MSDSRKSNDVFHREVSPASVLAQHASRIQELDASSHASESLPVDNFAAMMARDFGVQVANETVPLPSEGRVYDVNHPLHGAQTIDIKAMTAREEDILMNQSFLKKGTVLTELLKSCIVDKRVNPADLLVGDRNALMMAVRVTGYGHEYSAEVTCSECGEKAETVFNLAELPLKPLTIEPVVTGQNLFEFRLPKSGVNVQFRFLTGRVEEDILVTQERQKKAKLGGDNLVTLQLQHAIVSVNGVSDRSKLATFVKMMPAYDSAALRQYIKDNEPGISTRQSRVCPSCEHEEEVVIPMGISFLWPNARK